MIDSETETESSDAFRCGTHPKLAEDGGSGDGAKGDDGVIVMDDGQRMRKQLEMEKKHGEAMEAWRHFAENLGNADIKKFLNVR